MKKGRQDRIAETLTIYLLFLVLTSKQSTYKVYTYLRIKGMYQRGLNFAASMELTDQ